MERWVRPLDPDVPMERLEIVRKNNGAAVGGFDIGLEAACQQVEILIGYGNDHAKG